MLTAADFAWDDLWWTTRLALPEWHGFAAGEVRGPAGGVPVVFAPEGRDDGPLDEAEIGLVRWLADHHEAVSGAALAAVAGSYDALRAGYGYSPEEQAEYAPDIDGVDDLRALIALQAVNVHNVWHGEVPYLGLQLACTWDDEHGLGVLLHGTRVVRTGGADTAILRWMATRDAAGR